MFERHEIFQTQRMFAEEHLDLRTVTMAINLLDCAGDQADTVADKIYDKICRLAEKLVPVTEAIGQEFAVPIINKRISVTPIAMVGAGLKRVEDMVKLAKSLDRAAKTVGINYIGGYSALAQKGLCPADRLLMESLPQALNETECVCSSFNLASSRSGINLTAVRDVAPLILATAEASRASKGFACSKLVLFANAPEDNPFMAGAFCGPGEPEVSLNIGVSGPGTVLAALEQLPDDAPIDLVSECIKQTAFKITRMGQLVGQEASKRLGVPLGILDLSLAPTPSVGDSIARIVEAIGIEHCGGWGSTCAVALMNDAVKKGGMMAASQVGGLSGAFIPVSEDAGMVEAAQNGSLKLEKLEAMTCVCSVGLDMVAIPGDTPADILAGIIADELAVGTFNNKTTAIRILPIPDGKPGDLIPFGGLWGDASVMEVNPSRASRFVQRGGQVPAPIHSFKG